MTNSNNEGTAPKNFGWCLIIDGPLKHTWIPITYEFKKEPAAELEMETEYKTIAKHIRSPASDFPGVYCYRFEGEIENSI